MKRMHDDTPHVAFLLLGNSPTIPYSECESILESNGIPYSELGRLDQVLVLSAPVEACRVVVRQAGMVRRGGVILAKTEQSSASMIRVIDDLDLRKVLKPGMSFAVRVKGVRGHSKGVDVSELEKELGRRIKNQVRLARVNLENPDILFYTIITNNKALFCLNVAEAEEEGFSERRPGFRPFFHPSSMHPRLARAMVNLSGARLGSRFLDPFCGSGGILIEARLIGCDTIGIDIDLQMVKGSKTNLHAITSGSYDVVEGDARHLSMAEVDAVATDPPYGRSSSTKGKETSALVEGFLDQTTSLLKTRGKICLSLPSGVNMNGLASTGLKTLESHLVRVHRSLVRRITIFSKK
jgi:tRNA (guanine10-N2)-dimethyltransferase